MGHRDDKKGSIDCFKLLGGNRICSEGDLKLYEGNGNDIQDLRKDCCCHFHHLQAPPSPCSNEGGQQLRSLHITEEYDGWQLVNDVFLTKTEDSRELKLFSAANIDSCRESEIGNSHHLTMAVSQWLNFNTFWEVISKTNGFDSRTPDDTNRESVSGNHGSNASHNNASTRNSISNRGGKGVLFDRQNSEYGTCREKYPERPYPDESHLLKAATASEFLLKNGNSLDCLAPREEDLAAETSNGRRNAQRASGLQQGKAGYSNRSFPFLARDPRFCEASKHGTDLYRSVKEIWTSGKSVIDLVHEHATNQIYARKTLRTAGQSLPSKTEYERELRIMRLLSDFRVPHTTRLKSWSAASYSLVMYPVAECSLRQYLETPRASYRKNLIKWVGCLASAINFLHSPKVNITHGDVKPANILVQGSEIFLADFGESKVESPGDSKPQAGGRFTVMYSAPEVLEQGIRSKPTDIWALGCVFAEMFTVICGRSYQNYHKMLNTCSKAFKDFPAHKVRLRAILTWIQGFRSSCTAREHTCQQRLCSATNSIAKMLAASPTDRIDARQVLQLFPHTTDDCSIDVATNPLEIETREENDGVKNQEVIERHKNGSASCSQPVPYVASPNLQCDIKQFSAKGTDEDSPARHSALKLCSVDADVLGESFSCPANNSSSAFTCRNEITHQEPTISGSHLQVPGSDISSAAREEAPQLPRGRKRSASSVSMKPEGKPCARPEKCQVRIGFKDSEQQERASQAQSRRIVLQVSRQTRNHILQALSGPGRSSFYFIPLMLTPKYP